MKLYEKCILRSMENIPEVYWDFEEDRSGIRWKENEDFLEPKGPLKLLIKVAVDCQEVASKDLIQRQFDKGLDKWGLDIKDVYDYLGVEMFIPHMFLNISPNWKGDDNIKDKVCALDTLVNSYMKESERFLEWTYIIENGSNGDLIHAHIVAKMNPKFEKSTVTHFNKSNHVRQLKKYAQGSEVLRGKIEGKGINRMILRNPELVQDKLNYLQEELKPVGHKNKSNIWEEPKFVSYFTVK